MSLDELAAALLPGGHDLHTDPAGVTSGTGTTASGATLGVVGISGGQPVGVDAAVTIAGLVLAHVARGDAAPLLVLVDTQSQRMSRRDELLGLNECLAHLCKSFALASLNGCRTIGVLYGAAAAGAFIATALATDILVAVPGAEPSVMDLKSIARVTKLPLERLEDMAKTTPIFAPGLAHLAATGAVTETWDDDRASYAQRLDALIAGAPTPAGAGDTRDQLGAERRGRLRAAAVAGEVMAAALGSPG